MLIEIFSYSFLVRAFIVGLAVSISASLLGVALVLKKFSMIGDGLSHVGFGSLAIASVLSVSPIALSLPVVVVSAFLLLRFSEKRSGDNSVALLSSSALAIGVIAVSLGGINTDLNSFLFGSIVSVSKSDSVIALFVSLVTILGYILFYHKIYAIVFDPVFAKASGIRYAKYNTLLSLLTALTIVVGMRILGSLLISSLIIFPASIAMKSAKSYLAVTVISASEAIAVFMLGFFLSYAFSLPTGSTIVVIHMLLFVIVSLAVKIKDLR